MGSFRYCRSCQFDFDAGPSTTPKGAAPPAARTPQLGLPRSDNQSLARSYKAGQNFGCLVVAGQVIGAVLGFIVPAIFVAYLMPGANGLLDLAVIVIGPLVGFFVGGRVVVEILAK